MLFTLSRPHQSYFVDDIHYLSSLFLSPFSVPIPGSNDIIGQCVYGYLRETADEYGPANSLYYIGEGTPTRPFSKHYNVVTPDPKFIVIFAHNLTKEYSMELETQLITLYGRIDINTGILLNKTSGGKSWGPLGKVYDTQPCMFCGEIFATNSAINLHQEHCELNPSRKPHKLSGIEFQLVPCQFCGDLFKEGSGLKNHEIYYCKVNPTKLPTPSKKSYDSKRCLFCDELFPTNTIISHQRRCLSNPNRTESILKGAPVKKVPCPHCNRLFGEGPGITRHKRACHSNPNRSTVTYTKC